MSCPQVLIIGDFPFPYGSAGANLLRGHCVALQAAGYSIGVLPKSQDIHDTQIRETTYRGVRVWNIPQFQSRRKRPNVVQQQLNWNDTRIHWLKQADLCSVKAILAYTGVGGSSAFYCQLISLCKKSGVKLFCYVVEWHDWRHFKGIDAFLNIADSEFLRRVALRLGHGTITISELLQSYYARPGFVSICVPPLLDLEDPKWLNGRDNSSRPKYEPMKLLFSGSHRRERHDVILRAVLKLRQEGADIVIEYLGPTRDEIQGESGVDATVVHALGSGIYFHGRVTDDEKVAKVTAATTYGIILRDNAHWAQACFPSKVVEFAALGVPMICNISSDLGRYLDDGFNSLICEAITVDALSATLRRAWELTDPQYRRMQLAALKTAERFDARKYGKIYQQLIG